MAGEIKFLRFDDGVTVNPPDSLFVEIGALSTYVDDAAYVAAKASAAALGDIYLNSTSNLVRYYNGSAWGFLVSESGSQDLTNKTSIGIGTASVDASSILDTVSTTKGTRPAPSMTQTQRNDIGTPATGLMVYNTTVNQYQMYNGTSWSDLGGGGTGEINYISNGDAEDTSATGWATYDDGASATPVNGTAGSSSTLTLTNQSTTKIRGDYTFKLAHSAADGQGEGISYDFAIDKADQNKMLKLAFDYNTDGTYADGDLVVYIYDVDTSTLITPSVTSIAGWDKDNSGSQTFMASWVSTSSTNYRLIIHVATISPSTYDLYFDNVVVGPGSIQMGAALSPWQNFTPSDTSYSWGTVSASSFYYRQVGTSIDVTSRIVLSSAITGTFALAPAEILPPTLTVDTSAVPSETVSGYWWGIDASTGNDYSGIVLWNGSNFYLVTSNNDLVAASSPFASWASSDRFAITLTNVQIAEWAGAGNLYAGQNDVEYYSVGGTWDADSTTTVQGPGGVAMGGTLGAMRTKTITLNSAMQPTDSLELEMSRDGVIWSPMIGTVTSGNKAVGCMYNNSGSFVGCAIMKATSTSIYVYFGQYAAIENDDGAGYNWGTDYWRVKRTRAGNPVGFGIASGGKSGLISAYEEGTWTPTRNSSANLSTSPVFGTAGYTRIGNFVMAYIDQISNLTVTTGGTTYTWLEINTTGLPGLTNTTVFSGGANCNVTASPYEAVAVTIQDSSASTTRLFMRLDVNNGAASGDTLNLVAIFIMYKI